MPKLSDKEKVADAVETLKLIADTSQENQQFWPAAVARAGLKRILDENTEEG